MPTSTGQLKSDIAEDALEIAADVRLDTLLEHRHSANPTIRFVCAVRKALLEAPPDALSHELARVEQLVNRLYERIGHDRRSTAYQDSTYAQQQD